MRRSVTVLVGVALLAAAGGGTGRAEPPALGELMRAMRVTPLEPQAPPPLTVTTVDRASVSLADLRGQVVLVYFWATW